jgi:cohesin complex subunit SA-1/2
VSNVLGTVTPKPGMSDDYTVLIMDFEYAEVTMKVFLALEKTVAKLSNKQLDAPVSEDIDDAEAEPADDDDPMSDVESDDGDDAAQQQHREAKLLKPLLAQMSLCKYTSKLVLAISAGVIRDKKLRKRLELNKAKLGPNFKEVLAFLDAPGMQQRLLKKSKAKPTSTAAQKKNSRAAPKSNAIVAEDDEDDEIEDDGPDDDAARQRALEEEEEEGEEAMGEAEDAEEGGAVEEDEDSVIGD